mgnify:CR=1 FL=1
MTDLLFQKFLHKKFPHNNAQQCHEKSKTFPKRPIAVAIDSKKEPLFLEGSRYAVCLTITKLSLPFYICQKICGSFFS